MQQILHNNTKQEAFKESLKLKSAKEFRESSHMKSIGIFSISELEAEVKKLTIAADPKETIAEDLLKNTSEPAPTPQVMSVYESLIERVTTNEKSLVMVIEAFRDLSRLAESLERELSKLIQFVLSHEKRNGRKLGELQRELRRKREEIEELKETQSTLEYIGKKQEHMLAIILGLLLICVAMCYYYKSLIKSREGKKGILLCRQSYERSLSDKSINR
eukprot:TRINITY_DN2722_c0_g1_i12.p1 TRINITY_DN2722_c0_g1~~TRINITY_DN2722_c0_g1_i12.p1  ORF type:complete len:218 (+),score=64.72 TRINITY_DN2722_c0_g1_i12:897-1550(+)